MPILPKSARIWKHHAYLHIQFVSVPVSPVSAMANDLSSQVFVFSFINASLY